LFGIDGVCGVVNCDVIVELVFDLLVVVVYVFVDIGVFVGY